MFIEELNKRKEHLQLSTEQLAGLTGIPTGIINQLLRGEIEVSSSELIKSLEKALFPEKFSDSLTLSLIKESSSTYQTSSMGKYTLEDYLALPKDVRAELIDGKIVYMESPTVLHQAFLFKIAFSLETFIQKNQGTCSVFIAPLDVQLDCDDKTMVQPDIILVCDRNKITEKRIYGAPDFCIEIMSFSTRSHDRKTKLRKYRLAGVKEYWMVDIQKRQTICYFFEDTVNPAIFPFEKPVPLRIFNSRLTIHFSKIEAELIR